MLEHSENCLLIFLELSGTLLKKHCSNMVWYLFGIIWLKVKGWKSLQSFLASIAKMTQFLQWEVRHPFILIADSLMIDNSFLLTGKGTLNFWKQEIVGSWIGLNGYVNVSYFKGLFLLFLPRALKGRQEEVISYNR